MTHEDAGHYAAKHSDGCTPDPAVQAEIRKHATGEIIPCVAAFAVCHAMNLPPGKVGCNIDLMELRIVQCQLGLFGYGERHTERIARTADSVPDDLETALRGALVNNRLPCAAAWEIAETFAMKKMDVSAACNTLDIKIKPCQLGAF